MTKLNWGNAALSGICALILSIVVLYFTRSLVLSYVTAAITGAVIGVMEPIRKHVKEDTHG